MIRLSVLYPASEGATFDHDYYRDHHVPLAVRAWSPLTVEIDKSISGPYVAAVHFTFASIDAMTTARSVPESAEVSADVANYTTIKPVAQISEIVSSQTF